jgi:hypothetical protein
MDERYYVATTANAPTRNGPADHPPLNALAEMLAKELIRGQASADRVMAALQPGGPGPMPGKEKMVVASLYDHFRDVLNMARELMATVESIELRVHSVPPGM